MQHRKMLKLANDPEMEVSSKLLCYLDLTLLAWYAEIIWDQYSFAKREGLKTDHGHYTPK